MSAKQRSGLLLRRSTLVLAGWLLAVPYLAQSAPWQDLTFDATNDLTGVAFTSDSRGVVVGPNKTIYQTTNGGSSFSSKSVSGLDATRCCHSVKFLDSSTGWIGGIASVLRTTSGGSSWGGTQIIGIGGSVTRYGIAGVSTTVAWQVGLSNGFYRYSISSGGGSVSSSSWSSFPGVTLRDVHMFDADNGLAVGASGRIMRIAGGSASSPVFSTAASGTSEGLNAIFMLDATTGWIAGDNGTILKTTNGGVSWAKKSTGTVNDLEDVHFRDTSIGWTVGEAGLILLSLDGGETWIPEASGTFKDLLGVHATSSYAYAVGEDGTILKRGKLGMLVTGVSPGSGPTMGGTPVTISGSGFKAGAQVEFDGTPAGSIVVVSGSMITAVSPQHGSGTVDVAVRNSDAEVVTSPSAFTYIAPPRRRAVRRPLLLPAFEFRW